MMLRKKITGLSILFMCLALTACSLNTSPPAPKPPIASEIRGAGATFPAPLYKKWIEEYEKSFPNRRVNYEAVGSGEGTTRFLDQSVDFGASDAALSDEQMAKLQRGAILIPVTAGSLAIAYNPEKLPAGIKLPRSVYPDIFLGKITRWNDARIVAANPELELPDMAITPVVRQDGSGTTFAFTNHLSAVSNTWREGPGVGKDVGWPNGTMKASGNHGVAGQIKRVVGAVGYVEFGTAKRADLALAILENSAGKFIEPTGTSGLATLVNAELPKNLRVFLADPNGEDSYPIVTYTWLLLYGRYEDPPKAEAVKHFVAWCLSEGQKYSEALGYIRLAPKVNLAASNALQNVGQ